MRTIFQSRLERARKSCVNFTVTYRMDWSGFIYVLLQSKDNVRRFEIRLFEDKVMTMGQRLYLLEELRQIVVEG